MDIASQYTSFTDTTPMRIAIVAEVFLPKIDGVVIRTTNLIRELQAAGDEVLVLCPQADGSAASPVRTVEFPSFPFPSYPEYRIAVPDESLSTAIRDFDPDVVHFLNPFAFGFQCYDVLQQSDVDIPVVFSFHTLYAEFVKRYGVLRPLSLLLWWLTRHYHNCASVNLTVSMTMVDELVERGFQNVHLWPPAVDTRLFNPEKRCPNMRRRLADSDSGRPLLLTVSRLAPEKNVEFLAGVLEKLPECDLAIVGDGPHRPVLEHRFASLPANFVGYLKGEELARAYASADAFVYASETETMGNVILEAMASGVPVIAPSAGGIPSLIQDRTNGLLFSPGDVTAAVQQIHEVLNNSSAAHDLADAGREFTIACNWKAGTRRVRSDYDRAIGRHTSLPKTALTARLTTRCLVFLFKLISRFTKPTETETDVRDIPAPKRVVATGADEKVEVH